MDTLVSVWVPREELKTIDYAPQIDKDYFVNNLKLKKGYSGEIITLIKSTGIISSIETGFYDNNHKQVVSDDDPEVIDKGMGIVKRNIRKNSAASIYTTIWGWLNIDNISLRDCYHGFIIDMKQKTGSYQLCIRINGIENLIPVEVV